MIPRTARSLSQRFATLVSFSIFFFSFFFSERAKRKVCSARHREMINPTQRELYMENNSLRYHEYTNQNHAASKCNDYFFI